MIEIKDFIIPENRRVWVVRSDEGIFYEHFIQEGCVAIGHIDRLIGSADAVPEEHEIYRFLSGEAKKRELSERSATAKFNQVRRFLTDISVNDWVVTLDTYRMRIGRVTSDAYVSQDAVYASSAERPDDIEMRFKLRRNVLWGPRLSRDNLPVAAARSVKSNLTVFNIDRHWRAIHHLALPFFISNDRLYISLWVGKIEDVSAVNLTSLINLLADFEIVAKRPEFLDSPTLFEQEDRVQFEHQKTSSLRIQTQLMSPGPIWGELILGSSAMATVMILYIMAFGGKIPLIFESEGLVDKDLRHRIIGWIEKRWINKGGPEISDRLSLQPPPREGLTLIDNDTEQVVNGELPQRGRLPEMGSLGDGSSLEDLTERSEIERGDQDED